MSTMMSLSNSDADESSDASTLGVIIGAIIGSCTIILATLVIFLLVAYAKKKRKLDKNKYAHSYVNVYNIVFVSFLNYLHTSKLATPASIE